MKYKKYTYDNYTIHLLKTNKFKSILVSLYLINDLKKENLTKNALLRRLLTTSTLKLKNEVEVTRKVYDLYGSGISITNNIYNNVVTTDFSTEFLEEKYTESGQIKRTLEYFFDTIFEPNVVNGAFEETNFNLCKKALYTYYEVENDNKNKLAVNNAYELIDEEMYKYRLNGRKEELDKLTKENMADYYDSLFKEANANIFIMGNVDEEEILSIINSRVNGKLFSNKNNYKSNVFKSKCDIKENVDVDKNNQSKLVMIYKILNMTKRERNVILPIFNRIFGVGNNSKLFKSVREENSLAYDIRTSASADESLITLFSGISAKNKDKAIELINKELENIKSGNISDEEFYDALNFRRRTLKQFEDENLSILYIKISSILFGYNDLNTKNKNLNTITKKEIVEFANKLELNIIYMLKGDSDNE